MVVGIFLAFGIGVSFCLWQRVFLHGCSSAQKPQKKDLFLTWNTIVFPRWISLLHCTSVVRKNSDEKFVVVYKNGDTLLATVSVVYRIGGLSGALKTISWALILNGWFNDLFARERTGHMQYLTWFCFSKWVPTLLKMEVWGKETWGLKKWYKVVPVLHLTFTDHAISGWEAWEANDIVSHVTRRWHYRNPTLLPHISFAACQLIINRQTMAEWKTNLPHLHAISWNN